MRLYASDIFEKMKRKTWPRQDIIQGGWVFFDSSTTSKAISRDASGNPLEFKLPDPCRELIDKAIPLHPGPKVFPHKVANYF